MISPRNKLVFWAGAVLVPAALAYAAAPELWLPLLCGILALVLATVLDAAGGGQASRGPKAITLSLEETVRLTKDREGAITIRLRNPSKRPGALRIGLALPREITSLPLGESGKSAFEGGFRGMSPPAPEPETHLVRLPEGEEEATFDWPCVAQKRGAFTLERAYLEVPSFLGLWDIRWMLPLRTEVRVYPNLLQDRRRLAGLFLNRGTLGIHAQRRVGKGREFEKLREYIPGDCLEDIHWKATARRGHPVTKMYQLERTQEVYVIIDASRLSARSTVDENGASEVSQLDRFIQAGLLLGLVAEKQGDHFGLITFSDRVHGFMRAGSGRAHFNACRDSLYTMEPHPVNPDFAELFSALRMRLRRRALLVFLTSLDDPVLSESFTHHLQLLARRHLILVNMFTPPGAQPLFREETVQTVDDVYTRLGGHLQWRDLRTLQQNLHHRGVAMGLLENETFTPDLVGQYMNVKQRQLL